MKSFFLIVIVVVIVTSVYSQESETPYSFKVHTGVKYTPIDYLGGGILNFMITKNKFGLSFRNDISMSIEKQMFESNYNIAKFRVSKYVDFHYFFNKKFSTSLGYGWVANKDEHYGIYDNYGYHVVSLGVNYLVSDRIILELKGDIPFVDYNSPVDLNVAFPASIGLMYVLN